MSRWAWVAAIGVVAAVALGCAGAAKKSDQSDHGLERDRGHGPSAAPREPTQGATPARLASAPMPASKAAPLSAAVHEALLAAALVAEPTGDGGFTLEADDRSDWEPTRLVLPLGQVAHWPTYFTSPPVDDRLARVRRGSVTSRLEAALAGAEREPITLRRAAAVPVEGARFSLETVVLPVKLLLHPPMRRELTPAGAVSPRAELPRAWQSPPAQTAASDRAEDQADSAAAEEAADSEPVPVRPVLPSAER